MKLLEKARWELLKDAVCCFEQILESVPNETASIWPLTSISQTIQVRWAKHAGHRCKSKNELASNILLHMDTPV